MRLEGRIDYICPEALYYFIYENDVFKCECWYQYLRYGHKHRKKLKGRNVHKCKIPNRVSIHERPEIVEERTEYGHWEGDSVVYPNKKAINTVNELMAGLVVFRN